VAQSLPILFVPDKQKTAQQPSDLPTAFRTIERWANRISLQSGIQQITSVDGSVTVTNPTGPVVDLHVAGGGGGLYASLTGPGETVTPGDLTQAGGLYVNSPSGTNGFAVQAQAGSFGIRLINYVVNTPIALADHATATAQASGVNLTSDNNAIYLAGGTSTQVTSPHGVMIASGWTGGPSPTAVPDGLYMTSHTWASTVVAAPSTGYFSVTSGTNTVYFYVYSGNPNTHVMAANTGAVCFDVFTPGIWLCTAGPSATNWTMYTLP